MSSGWVEGSDWFGDPVAVRAAAVDAVAVADEKYQNGEVEVLTLHLRGGGQVHVRWRSGVKGMLAEIRHWV